MKKPRKTPSDKNHKNPTGYRSGIGTTDIYPLKGTKSKKSKKNKNGTS